jgi:serine/threonine protein kinase
MLHNRYLIEDYIGGGGFAHIYRARDLRFGHRRAVKEAFYYDPHTRQQFYLESEFLLNAHHPNLVRGYAFFEQVGRLYLIMEYVDGQTLEDIAIDHIRRTGRTLSEAQVLDWVIPICEAAQALHQQPVPIIHRDIKPANVKLSRERGIPVLIDLGLAKLYSHGTQTITAALAFTPGYAPPEQYQAAGATDQRTDVYGLGASLFYLLTGYQPTEAPARLSSHALPALRTLNPWLSATTEAVVLRAMALDPAQRYQTASALATDLRAARAGLDAPLAPRGSTPSGGPATSRIQASLRPCTRCGTANPAIARFCMRCGCPLTVGGADVETSASLSALVLRSPVFLDGHVAAPSNLDARLEAVAGQRSASGGEGQPRTPRPSIAPMQSLPPPPLMPAAPMRPAPVPPAAAAPRATPAPNTPAARYAAPAPAPLALAGQRRTVRTDLEAEALATILALLALVCVSLSLLGLFLPPMQLFLLPGLGLALWTLGRLPAKWLGAYRMPLPHEFAWLAWSALGAGSVWVVILAIHWLVLLAGRH